MSPEARRPAVEATVVLCEAREVKMVCRLQLILQMFGDLSSTSSDSPGRPVICRWCTSRLWIDHIVKANKCKRAAFLGVGVPDGIDSFKSNHDQEF